MTTGAEVSVSRRSKTRPRSRATPSASKYPSLATIRKGATTDSPGRITYPSARIALALKDPPKGTELVTPAEATPGSARTRSSARPANVRSAASSGYAVAGRSTLAVITLAALNPGSTASTWRKLAKSRPAPMSRTSATATCVVTSAARITRVRRPPVLDRPSSRNAWLRLAFRMLEIGTMPRNRPVASAVASVKATTVASMPISLARGNRSMPNVAIARSVQ